MQTVSSEFEARTFARLRRITYRVLISFAKDFDAGVDFFTIGTSTIGGTDILKGSGSVLQEWDKYSYEDFTERVLGIEVNRETLPPTNPITLATCTIVLDNHDDMFSPGDYSSPLDGQLLPRRPVRVNLGFGGETIPKFVGVTLGKPEIDRNARIARFHCIDFLQAIMNIPLDEEIIFINQRTDQIIQALLETSGLSASQFDLDTGAVIIPFAYFKKGSKVGTALREIAEAELGNVSMAEDGRIKFSNRQSWNTGLAAVAEFDDSNIVENGSLSSDTVINVVEVFSKARQVLPQTSLWQANAPVTFSDNTVSIKPGETKIIFADFKDDLGDLPVTSVDDPEPLSTADSSRYQANSAEDGSGTDLTADVDLDSTDLFSTAFKMTFTNNGSVEAFITVLELFGTPAKVIAEIYKRVENVNSIGDRDAYEEHPYRVENDLIQDEVAATTLGTIIVNDRAEDDDQQRWIVKAIPQLQVGDTVARNYENTTQEYFVTRVNDIINSSGYRQLLEVSRRDIETYFRIGISTIAGGDSIGP